jgi:ATP-dependent Lhr-like helicase
MAARLVGVLEEGGALFFGDLQARTGLLEAQVEDALAELVAAGRVTADGFQGIRYLTRNAKMRSRQDRYRKRGLPVPSLEDAGRWSLMHRSGGDEIDYWARVEQVARALIRRWGVVIRATLAVESALPPWRDLLYVYRRLEARDEIAGGRFVEGFSGEQFAAREAAQSLRRFRDASDAGVLIVAAADPLNLTGVLVPGDRVPASAGNRVAWQDGVPVAARIAGQICSLNGEEVSWNLHQRLIREPNTRLGRSNRASTSIDRN